MTAWNKSNQASAAINNRRLIVHLLRKQGPLSRRQLAQRSGLRSSTVTYIVRDLLEQDIVRIVGKRERPGMGKKQVLLEVNPELGWVVGTEIGPGSASLVFLNARGDVIDRDHVVLHEPHEMLAQVLRTRVDNWLARYGEPEGHLLGVGVGVSGVVDPRTGVVLQSTRFNRENWAFGEALEQAFGCLSKVDNNANLAALAEARLGNGRDHSEFLHFLMNIHEAGGSHVVQSLGSSLFLQGRLYRGAHFGAGEIDPTIEAAPYSTLSAEQLLAIADREAPFDEGLRPLADNMIVTLTAIVDIIDPEAVILGGNLCIANEQMIDYIQAQLNRRVVPVPQRYVRVLPSLFMDHSVSMGAAVAALDAALPANGDETGQSSDEAFPTLAEITGNGDE